MTEAPEKTFSFGDFELSGAKRLLLKKGEAVALKAKTFDLLLTLVKRRGEILSKDEILETVWEGQFVEENNLTVQISALRKVFCEQKGGHQFIATISGKGYKFVAEIDAPDEEVIIENLTFSRIILDEEIEVTEQNGYSVQSKKNVESEGWQTRFDRLKQNRLMLGGLVFLIAVFGNGGYLWQSAKGKQNTAPFQQISIKQLTTNGKVSIAALAPDGKIFAYVVNDFGQRGDA